MARTIQIARRSTYVKKKKVPKVGPEVEKKKTTKKKKTKDPVIVDKKRLKMRAHWSRAMEECNPGIVFKGGKIVSQRPSSGS